MRLYLGSVIVNWLPLRRQAGEICLRDAQAYRLVNHDAGDIKMARTRVLCEVVTHHQTEIQRFVFGFEDRQLLLDHRRKLFPYFVKLFIFKIGWQFTGHLFVAQAHLFVTHIEQAVGTNGQSYMSLPNALLYKKQFVPACSCRPAGQSWAQALTQQDDPTLRKGDIVVTEDASREMAQPRPATPVPTNKKP